MLRQTTLINLFLGSLISLAITRVTGPVEPVVAQQSDKIVVPKREIIQTTTRYGKEWAANDWPYNNLVILEENKQRVGTAVLDRHGYDFTDKSDPNFLRILIKQPFAGVAPYRFIAVSTWSSRTDGCFMELLFQVAPPTESGVGLAAYIIPASVEVELGKERFELKRKGINEFRYSDSLSYEYYNITRNSYLSGLWYQARNEFVISSQQAKKLINTPPGQAKVILSFLGNPYYQKYSYPIGEGTTSRWKAVFSDYPDCSANGSPKALPSDLAGSSTFRSPSKNYYITDPEFKEAEIRAKSLLPKEVKLTTAERKQRETYQKSWSKRNQLWKFLGAWNVADRSLYIYPSINNKQVACVVTDRKGALTFYKGYAFKPDPTELQYNKSDDIENRAYRRQGFQDVLFSKDKSSKEVIPLFAKTRTLDIPNSMRTDFEKYGCSTTFLAANQMEKFNQFEWSKPSVTSSIPVLNLFRYFAKQITLSESNE